MAYQIPLDQDEYVIPDEFIPDNSKSATPVKFTLAPAEGADQARIKSILVATFGLADTSMWSPEVQRSVMAAFETGKQLFIRTVDKVEGLTVPVWIAKKHGLIAEKDQKNYQDKKAPFAIETGSQYAQICGYDLRIAMLVAFQVARLSNAAEGFDGRFFGQPSGSSGQATPGRTHTTARSARRTRGKRGTAAGPSTK